MVAVISKTGMKLMPTTERRARKLLKSGKAEIYKYRPIFTIRLTECKVGDTQPVEYKCDTGYQYIGISICSKKHEYIHEERILLKSESEHYNDCRKYRRARRNRKTRYRKVRFDNRRGMIVKDGFAPSIRNKRDVHIQFFKAYHNVMPITSAVFEMGQFDTQVLKAVAEDKPLPQGTDYQHGDKYGMSTLREAVFTRDGYKCVICGRSAFKNNAILHEHHVGFWKGDRSNRMANLSTVCEKCHTSKNHKPGGKLYGLEPKFKTLKEATFMTIVRFDMFKRLKETASDVSFYMTYGTKTKLDRRSLNIAKSHANDAYVMGRFHPKHRTRLKIYQKLRRNNRVLSKFYDAKYIDTRDGSIKSGCQLSCNRTKRNIPRVNSESLTIYRGPKISKGRFSIRKQHYQYRPHDVVWVEGKRYTVKGVISNGMRIALNERLPVSINKIQNIKHTGGWYQTA